VTVTTTVRRSLLYVPGDRPEMLRRAAQRGADSLILNLEDAVAPDRKDFAREAVTNALEAGEFGACERIVRINPVGSATGYRDLLAIARLAPDAILLPKVRDPEEVRFAAWTLDRLEAIHELPAGGVGLMCMIESAAGVLEARRIAGSSERVRALIFGAADFAEDAGIQVGADTGALAPVLMQILLAARAAGVAAADAPHMRPDDPEGLRVQATQARDLGFDGKSAIHPAQIPIINEVFSPRPDEIEWARRVLAALAPSGADRAMEGAALLDGELIEAPHAARARRILAVTARLGAEKGDGVGD
jgi:citrate lyase subunit beta/citryl-CoA lyase